MATKLIRYDGVNDPQQNIVTIDLSAIPNGAAFTVDILYSRRNLNNGTLEETGISRLIYLYSKDSSGNYSFFYEKLMFSFSLGLTTYNVVSSIIGDILYLDFVNPNYSDTVLFDCKLEY
jgi:hypothetical protein